MNSHSASKYFLRVFLLFCFFYAHHAYAEFLLFKVGDKASYTISQKMDVEHAIFGETTWVKSEATIDLDIEILSSNQGPASYPFDVELTLRKIHISEIQQDGISTTTISYDSDGSKK